MGKKFLSSSYSRAMFMIWLGVALIALLTAGAFYVSFWGPFPFFILVPESEVGKYSPPSWWVIVAQFYVLILLGALAFLSLAFLCMFLFSYVNESPKSLRALFPTYDRFVRGAWNPLWRKVGQGIAWPVMAPCRAIARWIDNGE